MSVKAQKCASADRDGLPRKPQRRISRLQRRCPQRRRFRRALDQRRIQRHRICLQRIEARGDGGLIMNLKSEVFLL